MSTLRNACFTLNNYTAVDDNNLQNATFYSYIVFGYEVGDQGTPHLQGYIELNRKTRFNTVKQLIGARAHLEARKGTQQQAIEYCKKGGRFFERGIKANQGARTDLDEVRRTALEEGMRHVTARFNLQGIKVAEKFLTYNEDPRDFKPLVTWLHGVTGAGKSRRAREICTDDVYTKNNGTKWWDGYDGHECCIIDDFRDSWWPITEMLSLLDRYEKLVEFKGGWRQFKSKIIVITSINEPRDCYKGTGEAIEQLLRRIDHTVHVVPHVPEVGGNTIGPDFTLL